MNRYLSILLGLLFVSPAFAQMQTLTAPTIKISWNAVTQDINNNPLTETVTYNVYGSQGCGAKTLQATTTNTYALITVAPGCYSVAVSASTPSGGEGAVSSPSLVLTIVAPASKPAQVTGVVASQS